MDWKLETQPALEEIRRMIKASGLSQRKVEQRAGFSRGYLSQILSRNLDLKVFHVLAVLDVLGCGPGEFFARAYPAKKKRRRALDEFRGASETVTDEVDEVLGRLYAHGVESLDELRGRVARCEQSIARLERQRKG